MTDDRSLEDIVDEALSTLVASARARDLPGALELFSDGASLFGSGASEAAQGQAELEEFFTSVFAWPFTVGWSGLPPIATRRGDILWFVTPATFEPIGEESPGPLPYRLSGVPQQTTTGPWKFELFNGSEPASE